MARNPKTHGLDYCDIVGKPAKTDYLVPPKYTGTCGKWIKGVRCGVAFVGPPSRRFCDAHSTTVQRSGKSV